MAFCAENMEENIIMDVPMNNDRIMLTNSNLPAWCGGGHLTAPEDFIHADRIIPFHVMIYVTKGVIYVTEEGVEYSVGPGELLFLKAGLHHFGERTIERGTEWYYVHFYLDEPDEKQYMPYERATAQEQSCEYRLILPKKLEGLSGSDMEKKIEELDAYMASGHPNRLWFAGERLFRVLSNIALVQISAGESIVERVEEYLTEHFRENICFRELSGAFFISYPRLAARFSEEKGMSMGEYVKRLRLHEAAGLLRSSLKGISEIAMNVGYQDPLYFSKVFASFYGVSPRKYRMLPREY